MAKKPLIYQTGITTDNKKVLGGLFKLYETSGLPLDIIFNICIERNSIPDWIDFYKFAINAGMSHDRIISKLDEAISDSYGFDFKNVVIFKLNNLFLPKESK